MAMLVGFPKMELLMGMEEDMVQQEMVHTRKL